MNNIACFDIGGTFIKFAVMDDKGEILTKNKFRTPVNDCKNTIPSALVEKTKDLMKDYEITALAISTAGVVDSALGEIISATDNLPGYVGAKLKTSLEEKLQLKVFVENDVNAAALGEMWKGAAKNCSTFLCLTLGTGVGGAIIIDNKLYKGINNGAGELGHMIFKEGGETCNCGGKGCYERYASTSAFIRMYISEANKSGNNITSISGEEIMEKVERGEEIALRVYEKFIEHVSGGLASLAHIFDPGLIVIGGGISAQGKPFFNKLRESFTRLAMRAYGRGTAIVQAELQNDAGIYGAAYMALKAMNLLNEEDSNDSLL